MGKIKLLTEKTANQIAAGEVVERPLSIVKELIENSLDAGAENITVDVEKGGKKRITITDDGCGMTEDDLFMALERHATSKIREIADLEILSTMGFRGEAVPSIAAVTRFSIASAMSHGEGFKIVTENGNILENRAVPMPKGTEIVCSNLFHNVPARKKFLKSDEREFSHIRETVQKFSIINHNTGFSLISNLRNIFSMNRSDSVFQRIADVWKLNKEMIRAFSSESAGVNVTCYVPSPAESPVSLTVVSVNGRVVNDRFINGAIMRTFREEIGGEFRSPAVIMIEIDKSSVDINVHPSKLEVRFKDPFGVAGLISRSIIGALRAFRQADVFEMKDSSEDTAATTGSYSYGQGSIFNPEPSHVADKGGEKSYLGDEHVPENESIYGIKIRDYKKIGVLFGVYLIIEMADKVLFLDQHAAHERVTFTALKKASELKSGLSQMLIAPVVVVMSSVELDMFNENKELFDIAGFLAQPFDENSIIIRAVPALGFEADWQAMIKEMVGQLRSYGSSSAMKEFFLSHLATTACRASVKRNDILSDIEIDSLIDDINNSIVLTCPHGRPFFFSMSRNEFEKKVKRQ